MSGSLYIVGTPIGNLGDFSPRGIEVLSSVDFIAAEDTRVTRKLLTHFQISTPLISYHQHNSKEQAGNITEKIISGQSAALVSDAGMPVVSDPGATLIELAHKNGITVIAVPGPTASVTALALSGMPGDKFLFEGFLKGKASQQRKQLEEVEKIGRTLVYYEAPHKLLETLRLMLDVFGNRKITISREITKMYEETLVFTLDNAVSYYNEKQPRGEFVLVVEGNYREIENTTTFEEAVSLVLEAQGSGIPLANAAKEVAALTGYKKNQLYKSALGNNND